MQPNMAINLIPVKLSLYAFLSPEMSICGSSQIKAAAFPVRVLAPAIIATTFPKKKGNVAEVYIYYIKFLMKWIGIPKEQN